MSEDSDEGESPAVGLGNGETVEGAPVSRVASRLTWPQERSEVVRKEGASVIRTPDGPRQIADVLDEAETTYFATRQDFLRAVRAAVGTGPVPTG